MTKNKKPQDLIERVFSAPTHLEKPKKPETAKPPKTKPQGKPAKPSKSNGEHKQPK